MKKSTLNILVDVGLLMVLALTILASIIEIFIPFFVHVVLGLLFSAGVLIHILLHWEWIKNTFEHFGHSSSKVCNSFLFNLVLFLAYSVAGTMGLIARSFIFMGPLRHVLGFFHFFLISGALFLQIVHLIRHLKWMAITTQKMLGAVLG